MDEGQFEHATFKIILWLYKYVSKFKMERNV